MKKMISFLSGFLFLLTIVHSGTAQDIIVPEISKAIHLIEIDQTGAAIKLLNEAIAATPVNASLLYYLGYAQIKKGELDKALNSFEKGIQVDPKEALNYAGKGHAQLLKNNLVEAKKSFDEALNISKSKNNAVLNAIAEAYMSTKKNTNDALQILNKAKQSSFETLILLGDAYLQQNNGGQAVSSYEKAVAADPKRALPHYKIGNVYSRSKNVQASEEAYNKAIAIDPQYTLAYKELGEIYYFAKEGEKAVKAQESYLALTENPNAGKLQYAFYIFMTKNYTKANEIFKQVIQLPDVPAVAYRYYAISLSESGDLDLARTVFEQYFTKVKPEEIVASDYLAYARALLKAKQDSLAVDNVDKSLALDSNQIDALQLKGETLFKMKKYHRTIETYKKLMAKRKSPAPADNFILGRAFYFNGQLPEADSAFSTIIRLQPTMTVGYLWKARTKSAEDPELKQALAKPYFEKLIEVALTNPEKYKNDLVDAYRYMAAYSYNFKHDVATTKSYYEKLLVIKPGDPDATQNLDILRKQDKAPKKP